MGKKDKPPVYAQIEFTPKAISESRERSGELPHRLQVAFVGQYKGYRFSMTRHLHLNGSGYSGNDLTGESLPAIVPYPGEIASGDAGHLLMKVRVA